MADETQPEVPPVPREPDGDYAPGTERVKPRAAEARWQGVALGDMTRAELMQAMVDMAARYEAELAGRDRTIEMLLVQG